MSLHSTLTPSQYDEIVKYIRLTAKTSGFDRIFAEKEVDLLMGPSDGRIVTIAAVAGYSAGVVPLEFADDFNRKAYGVTIVAKAGREDRIFEAKSAWEKTMPGRKRPPLLKDWDATKATSSLSVITL
jgi:amidase